MKALKFLFAFTFCSIVTQQINAQMTLTATDTQRIAKYKFFKLESCEFRGGASLSSLTSVKENSVNLAFDKIIEAATDGNIGGWGACRFNLQVGGRFLGLSPEVFYVGNKSDIDSSTALTLKKANAKTVAKEVGSKALGIILPFQLNFLNRKQTSGISLGAGYFLNYLYKDDVKLSENQLQRGYSFAVNFYINSVVFGLNYKTNNNVVVSSQTNNSTEQILQSQGFSFSIGYKL